MRKWLFGLSGFVWGSRLTGSTLQVCEQPPVWLPTVATPPKPMGLPEVTVPQHHPASALDIHPCLRKMCFCMPLLPSR